MTTTAVSSFWLLGFFPNSRFSPIHLLSVWVPVCVVAAVHSALTNKINRHKRFTVGANLGLIAAGAGALLPGRLAHSWLFGG
ncbi:MAG: hypothetical protein V4632_17615 [Pseudomonadota bacterium]